MVDKTAGHIRTAGIIPAAPIESNSGKMRRIHCLIHLRTNKAKKIETLGIGKECLRDDAEAEFHPYLVKPARSVVTGQALDLSPCHA